MKKARKLMTGTRSAIYRIETSNCDYHIFKTKRGWITSPILNSKNESGYNRKDFFNSLSEAKKNIGE